MKTWAPEGVKVEKKDCLSHHEVMTRAEVYDAERGVKLVGHRVCFSGNALWEKGLIAIGLLPTKMGRPPQPSSHQLRTTLPHLKRIRPDTTTLLHEGRVHGEDGATRAIR